MLRRGRRLRRSAEIIGPKKITQRRTVIGNCRTCGGHVMTSLPAVELIDVFSATIPDFPFRPQLHVNYAETVLPMRDGLLAIPLFDRCLLPRWTRRVHVSIAFTADYTIIMFGFDSDKDKSSSVRKPSKSVN
jgi:hypothetical protein